MRKRYKIVLNLEIDDPDAEYPAASITGSKRGFGRCYRCNRTWQSCRSHSTQFSREEGCFALCEECWQVLDVEGRLVYYRRLWQDWNRIDNYPQEEWTQIELAVRQGK